MHSHTNSRGLLIVTVLGGGRACVALKEEEALPASLPPPRYSGDLNWPASSHKATYLAFPQRKQFAEHERAFHAVSSSVSVLFLQSQFTQYLWQCRVRVCRDEEVKL